MQGVDEYKELSQNVIAIFILPPNYDEWRRRLAARYATPEEFDAEWPKRRASAIAELQHALEVPYYHVIINDNLDNAVAAAQKSLTSQTFTHAKTTKRAWLPAICWIVLSRMASTRFQ